MKGFELDDEHEKKKQMDMKALFEPFLTLMQQVLKVFESSQSNKGMCDIAEFLAELTEKSGAMSFTGGGDSMSAVNKAGLAKKMSHISTGGDANLELLGGSVLPGEATLHEDEHHDGDEHDGGGHHDDHDEQSDNHGKHDEQSDNHERDDHHDDHYEQSDNHDGDDHHHDDHYEQSDNHGKHDEQSDNHERDDHHDDHYEQSDNHDGDDHHHDDHYEQSDNHGKHDEQSDNHERDDHHDDHYEQQFNDEQHGDDNGDSYGARVRMAQLRARLEQKSKAILADCFVDGDRPQSSTEGLSQSSMEDAWHARADYGDCGSDHEYDEWCHYQQYMNYLTEQYTGIMK